jgi:hypothetical protein
MMGWTAIFVAMESLDGDEKGGDRKVPYAMFSYEDAGKLQELGLTFQA